ncbi:hypothetical protein [Ferruginibacter sp.]
MTDIISIVTMLFLLSMLQERIAEFFKTYLSCKKMWGRDIVGDTTTKFLPGDPREQRRHYRILKLNIWIGFLTAFLCHASLFDILKVNTTDRSIGWPDHISFNFCFTPTCILNGLSFIVGCLLTGILISLGSKFWHDVLDILLEVKNVKKSISQQIAVNTGQPSELAFTSLTEKQQVLQIQAAIKLNRQTWLQTIPNVTGVGIGNKIKGGDTIVRKVIRFEVSTKEDMASAAESIPPTITFNQFLIPTDVVPADKFNTQYAHPGDDDPRKCGASISRVNDNSTGTISLKVSRKENGQLKHFLLTCAHVVMQEQFKNGITEINRGDNISKPGVISPGLDAKTGGKQLGKLVEAKLTEFTDSALVELDNEKVLEPQIYDIGDPGNKTRAIDETDVDTTKVKFCGAFSGLKTDITIRGYGLSKQGNYPAELGEVTINELISIDKSSHDGDSGAAVIDEKGMVIGIIVGSSETFTYVIPIQSIKSAHKQFIII